MPPDDKKQPTTDNTTKPSPAVTVINQDGTVGPSSNPRNTQSGQDAHFLSFNEVIAKRGKETPEELRAGIRLLRTYQSDVAEAMKGGESLASMAIAENTKKDQEQEELAKRLEEEGAQKEAKGVADRAAAEEVRKAQEQKQNEAARQAANEARLEEQRRTEAIRRNGEELRVLAAKRAEEEEREAEAQAAEKERAAAAARKLSTPESRGEMLSKILNQAKSTATQPTSRAETLISQTTPTAMVRPASKRVGSPETTPRKSHVLLPLILSLFFFVVGGAALYIVYKKSNIPVPPTKVTPISFSNYQSKIITDGFTRASLVKAVDGVKQNSIYTSGSLVNLVLVESDPTPTAEGKIAERLVETAKLFSLFESRAPSSFVRSLNPEFVFGLHFVDTAEPFLILKTNFYDGAFSGMLAWEKTIAPDLLNIFTHPKEQASSTPILGEKLGDWNDAFEDKVVKNKDVRILKDNKGSTVLLYSFINKETLIIATNEATFNEVYDRLTVSSFTR